MKRAHFRFGKGFRVSIGNKRGQAAEMVIPPGDCEGGPDNRHRGADQWLFVVAGKGLAIVNGKRHPLRDGSIVRAIGTRSETLVGPCSKPSTCTFRPPIDATATSCRAVAPRRNCLRAWWSVLR